MVVDRATGVVREAEIFVAVLGASNYTYAEATWTQKLTDWIEAHVRMFRFFGGVPRLVVPDNLKSGVHRASFYDPEINRSYGMMASHYGVGILPARPRKSRDKAKVEAGVRFAQTYSSSRAHRRDSQISSALYRSGGVCPSRCAAYCSRNLIHDSIGSEAIADKVEIGCSK
jgi:transposase